MLSRQAVIWVAGFALLITLLSVMFFNRGDDALADFAVFHRAGERFLAGEQLYQTSDGHYQFKYLPGSAAFFASFGLLPLSAAKYVWMLIVVASIVGLLRVSFLMISRNYRVPAWAVVVTVLAMGKFFLREIELGQTNALLYFLLLSGVWLATKQRDRLTGILTGLAVALKPYAIIFLPWLLLRRQWLIAVKAVATLLVILLLPILHYGITGTIELFVSWRDTVTQSTPGLLTNPDNVSLFGAVAKWFGAEPYSQVLLITSLLALVIGVLCIWVFLARVPTEPSGRASRDVVAIEAALLLLLIPLLSPQGWDYLLLAATPGVMLLLSHWSSISRWKRYLLGIDLAVIGLSIYDLMGRELYHAFMNSAVLTAAALTLLGLLLDLRFRLARSFQQNQGV